jgi:protein MPE1
MTMRFDGRDGAAGQGSSTNAPSAAPAPTLSNLEQTDDDESARIAAMFQAQTEQWDETQERMANATYRERGGAPRRGGPPRPPPSQTHQAAYAATPDRPPPIGYICFRCGTKGHWIHDCPTNNDRDFDNKPRYKRTTGIPKSMLKTIEAPTDEMRREGVMVTPDGSYVVAQVDSASWARSQALRNKPLTKSDIYSSVPSDSKLACSLCNKLLRDAVRTPCCSTLFCQECVVNYLLEHDFQCAECDKRIKDLGTLKREEEVQKQVREYIDGEIDKSEKKIQEVEQAERDEVEKARKEKEDEENAMKGKVEGESVEKDKDPEGTEKDTVVKKEGDGGDQQQDQDGNDGNAAGGMQGGGWNPQAVQQIMTMLCNPSLPPPMRMQLQMQLQFMQNQFMQNMMQQQSNGGQQQQTQFLQQQQPVINPYAGQHQMGVGFMGMFPAQQDCPSIQIIAIAQESSGKGPLTLRSWVKLLPIMYD